MKGIKRIMLLSNYGKNHLFYKMNFIKSKPRLVAVNPTLSCNMRCKHCDIWKTSTDEKKKPEGQLTDDEWKAVVPELKRWLGSFHLTVSGGEPLLKKNTVIEIIKSASDNGILTRLMTNGWLADANTIKELGFAGLDVLTFSLDGLAPETHDFTRGTRGSHKRITSAIEYMKENKNRIKININTIIMESNLDEIPGLLEWASGRGVGVKFQALVNNLGRMHQDDSWPERSELWPRDSTKTTKAINKIISMKQRGYPVENSIKQLKAFSMYYKDPVKACGSFACESGRNIAINPNGNIKMCPRMKPIGNIKDWNSEGAWRSPGATKIRKDIKECEDLCKILNCNFDYGLRNNIKRAINM
jgi:MoaA/NifB/PqqE/SkfB family radical SAM enzyme